MNSPLQPETVMMPSNVSNYWYDESQKGLLDDVTQGEKYQNITYFKFDKINNIDVKNEFIDFPNAIKKIKNLSVMQEIGTSFIGFTNMRTKELLQFLRLDEDLWYADVPIDSVYDWDGYVWGCRADIKSILTALELFFEEASWFETLPFTMRRHKSK